MAVNTSEIHSHPASDSESASDVAAQPEGVQNTYYVVGAYKRLREPQVWSQRETNTRRGQVGQRYAALEDADLITLDNNLAEALQRHEENHRRWDTHSTILADGCGWYQVTAADPDLRHRAYPFDLHTVSTDRALVVTASGLPKENKATQKGIREKIANQTSGKKKGGEHKGVLPAARCCLTPA